MKIFYDPKTLQIKGLSDGENSLDFPFVESELPLHSIDNLYLERERKIQNIPGTDELELLEENIVLKFYKGTLGE